MAARKLTLVAWGSDRSPTAHAKRQGVQATSRTGVKLARVLLGLGLILGFGAAVTAPRATADTLPATSIVGPVVFTVTGPVPGDAVPHVAVSFPPTAPFISAFGVFRDGAYSWAVSDDNLPIAGFDGYKFDLPAVAPGESYTVQFAVQLFECGGCEPLLGDPVTISADTQTATPTPTNKARLALVSLGDDPDAWAHGIAQQTWATTGKGDQQYDDLAAGEYLLETSGPVGYTTSAWSCVAADKTIVPVVDSKVTLTAGSDVTCSITHTKLTTTPATQLAIPPAPVSVCGGFGEGGLGASFWWPYKDDIQVSGFKMQASTDGGATWTDLAIDPNGLPPAALDVSGVSVLGLDPALTAKYQFRIAAWNTAGMSEWSTATAVDYYAVPDAAAVTRGETATINLTSNDGGTSVPDSIMLSDPDTSAPVTSVTYPGKGTFSISGNVVTFVPQVEFTGEVSTAVNYMFGDCALTSTVKVTVVESPRARLKLLVAGEGADQWKVGYTFQTGQTLGPSSADWQPLNPGETYTLVASGPSGAPAPEWACFDDTGQDPLINGQITPVVNQSITCTLKLGSVLGTSTTLPTLPGNIANGGSDVELGSLGISVVFLAGGLFLAARRRR